LNPPKQEVEKETDYREACESGRYLPPAYRRMKTNPRRGGEGAAKSRIRRRTEQSYARIARQLPRARFGLRGIGGRELKMVSDHVLRHRFETDAFGIRNPDVFNKAVVKMRLRFTVNPPYQRVVSCHSQRPDYRWRLL
jgi:hypothetical protein